MSIGSTGLPAAAGTARADVARLGLANFAARYFFTVSARHTSIGPFVVPASGPPCVPARDAAELVVASATVMADAANVATAIHTRKRRPLRRNGRRLSGLIIAVVLIFPLSHRAIAALAALSH